MGGGAEGGGGVDGGRGEGPRGKSKEESTSQPLGRSINVHNFLFQQINVLLSCHFKLEISNCHR